VIAIESTSKDDDTQWLIYWTVFGSLSVCDVFADEVVPGYWLIKCVVLVALYLPPFRGAEHVYRRYVRDTWLRVAELVRVSLAPTEPTTLQSRAPCRTACCRNRRRLPQTRRLLPRHLLPPESPGDLMNALCWVILFRAFIHVVGTYTNLYVTSKLLFFNYS